MCCFYCLPLNTACFWATAGPLEVLEILCCVFFPLRWGGFMWGDKLLAMLSKWLWKENWDWGGLMKYLRFRLKRELWKTLQQKRVGWGPSLSRGPADAGARGCRRCERRPILSWDVAGSAHSCVAALPPSHQPPAFVGLCEWWFYTELIAQQWLCVGSEKAPPTPDHQRLLCLRVMYVFHQPHILMAFYYPRMTRRWIPLLSADMVSFWRKGGKRVCLILPLGPGAVYLVPN